MTDLDEPPHKAAEPDDATLREVLEALPVALYLTDAEGRVTFFNRAAAELAGREPVAGEDRWCVTHRLYRPSGEPMAHDACPMAIALKEERVVRGASLVAERPDGSRAPVMPFPTPIHDASGKLVGGVNLLVDISELRAAQDALARRAEQQAALYRFTDRLYRARFVATAYEAALDAIHEAMGCERASILVADEAGTMRFVAWRGLSETYRRAVEGHSPWRPGERDPQPIWIADIDETDESEAVKAAVRAEGIVALAFIPLVASGALVGKFMVYHREPHAFSIGEREVALTIARQLGFSIEQKSHASARQAVEAALRESEARFRAIVDTTPECVTLVAPGGELLFVNRSGLAMVGASQDDEVVGGSVLRIVAPEDREIFSDFIDRVCGGEGSAISYDIDGLDGLRRRMETRAEPFAGADRRTVMLAVTRDVTEQVRAERQRALLINELNHRVKNTLATVQSLAVQTLRGAADRREAGERLEQRLVALAGAHDVLTSARWESAELGEVTRRAVAPFDLGEGRFDIHGPPVELRPGQALALSIALHELATNAARYGSLIRETGRVAIAWSVDAGDDGETLKLTWRESGGPPVAPPRRKGFGSRVIERTLAMELGGSAGIDYRPSGVVASIMAPLGRPIDRPIDVQLRAATA